MRPSSKLNVGPGGSSKKLGMGLTEGDTAPSLTRLDYKIKVFKNWFNLWQYNCMYCIQFNPNRWSTGYSKSFKVVIAMKDNHIKWHVKTAPVAQ